MFVRIKVSLRGHEEFSELIIEHSPKMLNESMTTGEIFELIQPALRDNPIGFRPLAIDVLIDIKDRWGFVSEKDREMDYTLPSPDGRYFDPVLMYNQIQTILIADGRFVWEK